MRAIANGQVDGFPPKEELRTVYVEHDIDAELSDITVVGYVLADPILQGEIDMPKVQETLGSVGFTELMQNSPVASLSGGWKMKLALGTHQSCNIGCCPAVPLGNFCRCMLLIFFWVSSCMQLHTSEGHKEVI